VKLFTGGNSVKAHRTVGWEKKVALARGIGTTKGGRIDAGNPHEVCSMRWILSISAPDWLRRSARTIVRRTAVRLLVR